MPHILVIIYRLCYDNHSGKYSQIQEHFPTIANTKKLCNKIFLIKVLK